MKDNPKAGSAGNQVKQKNQDSGNRSNKKNQGTGNPNVRQSAEMDYAKRYRLCRELMDKRTQLRELSDEEKDRMMFYGASLIRDQLKAGTTVYELKPVKLICLMDYEDLHERETRNKIVFQYGMVEVETCEVYGQQLTIYCVELPRVMELTDNFDSPVAGWCRIFRNIANFAEMRDGRFCNVVKEMKVRGLDEQEMIEYFSDMVTIDDIKPFIDGGHELGYRKGLKDGLDAGREKGREEGEAKGVAKKARSVAANMLADGLTTELVAKYTGLSEAEIKALKAN